MNLTKEELRIGNYVLSPRGIERVSAIGAPIDVMFSDNAGYELKYLSPIPLTEELLLRCGFEVKIEHDVCKRYHIGENPITKDWYVSLVWIIEPKSVGMPDYPFYSNGGHLIKYLHQLQNLYFALTGEELTLKD